MYPREDYSHGICPHLEEAHEQQRDLAERMEARTSVDEREQVLTELVVQRIVRMRWVGRLADAASEAIRRGGSW